MKRMIFVLAVMLGFGLMVCASSYAGLADGLVGYWSFDTGTARDGSGKGNHGKISGAPKVVDGKMGKALDFNGKDTGIDVPDHASLQLDKALTVAAWINVRKFVDHAGICWKGELIGWGTTEYNFRIATTGDGLTWGTCATGEDYFATAGAIKLNEWTFVALTADGKTAIGRVATAAGKFTIPKSDQGNPKTGGSPYKVWKGQPVRIGWAQGLNGDINSKPFYDGIIDEVCVYNRALTEAELTELMTKGLAPVAVDPGDKLTTTWSRVKSN